MGSQQIECCITVRGRVASHWSHWLGGLSFAYRSSGNGDDVTDLCGTLPDQGALQGVLRRIWSLNLIILSVKTSADEGDACPAHMGV